MAGHSHNHGGNCCDHPHDAAGDLGAAYSLYSKIDLDRVECLNESEEGAGKTIFKPWDQRLDFSKVCIMIIMSCPFQCIISTVSPK